MGLLLDRLVFNGGELPSKILLCFLKRSYPFGIAHVSFSILRSSDSHTPLIFRDKNLSHCPHGPIGRVRIGVGTEAALVTKQEVMRKKERR